MKTIAASAFVVTVVMAAINLAATQVYAQQATQAPAEQEQETEQQGAGTGDNSAENADEPAGEQADTDLPDIDNQPIQPGSGGPGRFIPSEQISQDLGVSFPVDI